MPCFSVPECTQLVRKAFYMEYRSNSAGKKVLHRDFACVACMSSAISSSEPRRTARSAWSGMACEGHTAPGELFISGDYWWKLGLPTPKSKLYVLQFSRLLQPCVRTDTFPDLSKGERFFREIVFSWLLEGLWSMCTWLSGLWGFLQGHKVTGGHSSGCYFIPPMPWGSLGNLGHFRCLW